jgi:hypothetical protein
MQPRDNPDGEHKVEYVVSKGERMRVTAERMDTARESGTDGIATGPIDHGGAGIHAVDVMTPGGKRYRQEPGSGPYLQDPGSFTKSQGIHERDDQLLSGLIDVGFERGLLVDPLPELAVMIEELVDLGLLYLKAASDIAAVAVRSPPSEQLP